MIDETPTGPASVSTWTSGASVPSSTVVVSSGSGSGTTTSAVPVGTATGTPVAHYGQCGGQTYTGSKTCVAPYVCTYSSAYYSQCL